MRYETFIIADKSSLDITVDPDKPLAEVTMEDIRPSDKLAMNRMPLVLFKDKNGFCKILKVHKDIKIL